MKPRAGLSMRTLHRRKKKQRLTFQENCPKRDTILLQEEKREKKNNVNKLCKDDERTAKEEKNTILTAYIISP